ncbi:pH-response regulator protein palC [Cyphellophora attinorum]|uniref:pH-response regulator protein palC n=1 Tax=Cyphellophora attinorum TaxID=1664694 RepID=A0A0N1P0Q1_9EURO|nr:pH-response regulator protein palC [Phialophora attinorum]KPI43657.1 pH-response regulator protein palC [Phialophora attinorum]
MPFPFVLPTTSQLSYQSHLTSSTHPSLPSASTAQRALVRSALKSHRRLSPSEKASNLQSLVTALSDYIRYLDSLDIGLGGKPVASEDIDLALVQEIDVEWRPTLTASALPGRESERVKGRGLDFELYFVYHTLALAYSLQARQSLLGLYAAATPSPDQRLSIIRNASQNLTRAHSLHAYLRNRSNLSSDGPPSFPAGAVDVSQSMQSALQNLLQAEINLLSVLKDDPYPAQVLQARNKDDREWMIKAPKTPKARAAILQRLCIGAAEKAAAALVAMKSNSKRGSVELVEYCTNIRSTARAKGCRFAAIEADVSGQTGKAIAWLHAGANELGVEIDSTGKQSRFSKLKNTYAEKREDSKIAKGHASWGADGGQSEERRVLDFLHAKYTRENDTINVQIVPEWRPLLALMPSAMNFPIDEKWKVETLAEDELARMRAVPNNEEPSPADSSDEDGEGKARQPAGAFPGTNEDYGRSSYY